MDTLAKRRLESMIKSAAVVYSIRRVNNVPLDLGKWVYLLLLSPYMLSRSLWTHDEISYKYRHFLTSLTYPECNLAKKQVFRHCNTFHSDELSCTKAFASNFLKTIKSVWKMYLRLYTIQTLIFMFLSRKRMDKKRACLMVKSGLSNAVRSSCFLGGQAMLQRVLLCLMGKMGMDVTPRTFYLISILGSLPIFFEREFRVKQVNSIILSQVIVGQMRKWKRSEEDDDGNVKKNIDSILPAAMVLGTLVKDQGRIIPANVFISLAAASTI